MNIAEICTFATVALQHITHRVLNTDTAEKNRFQALEIIVVRQQMQIENLQKLVVELNARNGGSALDFSLSLPHCGEESDDGSDDIEEVIPPSRQIRSST